MKARTVLQKVKRKNSLLAQLLFTALAFVAMILFSYLYMHNIIRDYIVRTTDHTLTNVQMEVSNVLLEPSSSLGSFSETVRHLLIDGIDGETLLSHLEGLTVYIQDFGRHLVSFDGFYGYFQALTDGPAYLDGVGWEPPDDYVATERPWYILAVEAGGAIVETPPYVDSYTGDVVVTYARALLDDEGLLLGVVSLDIQLSEVRDNVIATSLAHGGYGALLSQDLTVMAHPNSDFIGIPLKELDSDITRFADDIIAGREITEQPVISYRGEDSLAFFRDLPNGWYLAFVTPREPYYASLTNMTLLLLLLGGSLAAILMVILIRIDALRSKADAQSKQKSMFLSNMSHEIRTPINAIIGMTSIGKSATESERKNYCLNKIEDASKHLLGVINDILDMSKIEANKFELSNAEFSFDKMLRRVMSVINFRIEEKHQTFTASIDEHIPTVLVGDDQRLAQVIANLLGNSVKFTPAGGQIHLDVSLLEEKDDICTIQIAVKDSGIGISREQQGILFQSFQQAESSTSRKYGGTGLGLSISKNIVEMMGGKIWVDSEPEKGSTFTFTVLLARGQQRVEDKSDEKLTDWTGIFEGYTILLAEDVEINREIVVTMLEETGLEIDCAVNGIEALRMFDEAPEKYDMIFMDIQMPEMDGLTATEHIRKSSNTQGQTIPILAMTANVFREDIEKSLDAGMNGHIGKPLDFEEVLEKLREYLIRT